MKLWKQFSNCLMTRKEEETRRFARGTVHYGSTRGGRIFEEEPLAARRAKRELWLRNSVRIGAVARISTQLRGGGGGVKQPVTMHILLRGLDASLRLRMPEG